MTNMVIAGYGEGQFGPSGMYGSGAATLDSAWTRVILGLFHPTASGEIHFNNTLMFSNGTFQGSEDWINHLHDLVHPISAKSGVSMSISFGGGEVEDFTNIKNIYEGNGNSFAGTALEDNVNALLSTFGDIIDTVDMDVEDCYDDQSCIAFCELMMKANKKITFAPYTNIEWWINVLLTMNSSYPGEVTSLNLQCYSAVVDPEAWEKSLSDAGIDTDNFIIFGVKYSSTPSEIYDILQKYAGKPWIGGTFVWTIDQTSYVDAMINGIQST